MSRFQLKIIPHTKKQENLKLNEKDNQQTDANNEMTEVLDYLTF